jgi:hypothetical protein
VEINSLSELDYIWTKEEEAEEAWNETGGYKLIV